MIGGVSGSILGHSYMLEINNRDQGSTSKHNTSKLSEKPAQRLRRFWFCRPRLMGEIVGAVAPRIGWNMYQCTITPLRPDYSKQAS